jgi:hypothetical protein
MKLNIIVKTTKNGYLAYVGEGFFGDVFVDTYSATTKNELKEIVANAIEAQIP